MQRTKKKNVRYRVKRHKFADLLLNAREKLHHTFLIVTEYLIPHTLDTDHSFGIAKLLCEYFPNTVLKNIEFKFPYKWQIPVIESNNLDLIRKYKFVCYFQYCPRWILTGNNNLEVIDYVEENISCHDSFHKSLMCIRFNKHSKLI